MNILVIDDEDSVRELIRLILEREGHTIYEADNGKTGISIQRKTPCDMLLCDLIMPIQEGIETIGQFADEFPEVGIIAMSGGGKLDPDSYLGLAKQLGAWRVFVKPLKRQSLINTKEEWAQLKK